MYFDKKFRIAIGHKLQSGPYGGGNSFVSLLAKHLIKEGNEVYFDLEHKELDFIILTDPRVKSPNVSFAANKILEYLKKNPSTIVIHRINECDERKKTKLMNFRLRTANYCADHTIFVGTWLKTLNVTYNKTVSNKSVILNGADESIFYSKSDNIWNGAEKLKLVTHHWSPNWMKGFDIYKKIDDMLSNPYWRDKIEFTYIGNIPQNFTFKNSFHIKPLSGSRLAENLRKHHVYLTASVNEPGGNHQIEGGSCGLPIIFRNSGCLPEYCDGFGIAIDENDFSNTINDMLNRYHEFQPLMVNFPYTFKNAFFNWAKLLKSLDQKRDELLSKRRHSFFMKLLNKLI